MEREARGLNNPISFEVEEELQKETTEQEKKSTPVVYKDGFKILGNQYFRFVNDTDVDLIRVIGVTNADKVKVYNQDGDIFDMDPKDIQDHYDLLTPDGLVTFAVAQMGVDSNGHNVEDVVVCLYRQNEMEKGDYGPYVICRQNINDFFANYLDQTGLGTNICGVSVSRESCPENIDFDMVKACNGIDPNSTWAINIYIEDTLESILSMVKPNKMKIYNRVLESCYDEHLKAYPTPENKIKKTLRKDIDGYCLTLKELLEMNNFQYDLDSAYNILAINVVIEDVQEFVNDEIFGKYHTLPNDIMNELSKVFKQNIVETIVVPYNHEISLDDLRGTKYFILRDKKNLLYIINYITQGEYRETDLETIAAKIAMEKTRNLFGGTMKNKYENK